MMDTTPVNRKKLEDYIFMRKHNPAVAIGLAVLLLICGVKNPAFPLIAILFVVLPYISHKRRTRAIFEKFEEANQMELVLSDFHNGTFLCSDAVFLGEHVITGRGAADIFFYDEIAEVCQCAETGYKDSINKRELYVRRKRDILAFEEQYRLREGERLAVFKGQRLCLFPGNEVNEEELNKVYQFIQSKNPDVWIDPEIRYEAEDIVC